MLGCVTDLFHFHFGEFAHAAGKSQLLFFIIIVFQEKKNTHKGKIKVQFWEKSMKTWAAAGPRICLASPPDHMFEAVYGLKTFWLDSISSPTRTLARTRARTAQKPQIRRV